MIKNRKAALAIIFIFYITGIFIRLPNLNRPLSDHNEYIPANALMCLISWADGGGAEKFNFVPLASFQNEGDKIYSSPIADSSGNVLYITFGPGWCVLPYIISKVFHIAPTPLYLEILNLALHFISCFIFFEILCILFRKKYPDNYTPHIISLFVFVMSPSLLWIMGNSYLPGGVAMPFILMTIFYFAKTATDERQINFKNISLLFLGSFCSIYCDWIGAFIACALSIVSFLLARKNKRYLFLSSIFFLSAFVSLSLMFIQFASHTGLKKTAEILSVRLAYRTYGSDGHGILFLIKWVLDIFFTRNFSALLLIFFSFMFLKAKRLRLKLSRELIYFLITTMSILVIHNIVLLGWTAANDFSVMNYIIPFSVLAGILVYETFSTKQRVILLTTFFLVCLSEYYYFNRPGDFDRKHQPYNRYKLLGEQISKITSPNEVIFINAEPAPQGWYYARRNYYMTNNIDEAKYYFNRCRQDKCVYINQQNGNITWYKKLSKK